MVRPALTEIRWQDRSRLSLETSSYGVAATFLTTVAQIREPPTAPGAGQLCGDRDDRTLSFASKVIGVLRR
jgi:hypothetical protein